MRSLRKLPAVAATEAQAAALDLLVAAALHAGTLAALLAAPDLAARLAAAAVAALGGPQHSGAAAALLGNLCIHPSLRRQARPERTILTNASCSSMYLLDMYCEPDLPA